MNDQPTAPCHCATLPDLAVLPMESDGLYERVFATLETVREHGGDAWWLYLSRCDACGQHWMVAQEERIYDDFFLHRIDAAGAAAIVTGWWPPEFLTYEAVLAIGRRLSKPCRFFDPLAHSLVGTVQDLRKARPAITAEEMASLLGIAPGDVGRLIRAGGGSNAGPGGVAAWFGRLFGSGRR